MTLKPNIPLRWAALAAVLFNVLFNILYLKIPGASSIQQITHTIPDLFAPPGYVFAIWGAIYLSFIIYCVAQLLPVNHHEKTFDKLSPLLIAANTGCWIWVFVFSRQWIWCSMIVIIITLILAARLFLTATREIKKHDLSALISKPFSLFFGWMSVAAIANFSLLITWSGWLGTGNSLVLFTDLIIILAALLGALTGIIFRNNIYPLVILWALIGITLSRHTDHPDIMSNAIYAGAACILVVVVNIIRNFSS